MFNVLLRRTAEIFRNSFRARRERHNRAAKSSHRPKAGKWETQKPKMMDARDIFDKRVRAWAAPIPPAHYQVPLWPPQIFQKENSGIH